MRTVILISDNFEVDSRATPGTVVERALKTEAVYNILARGGYHE